MQEYLDMYDVQDQSKWEMLTGYKQEEITDFAAKSFKTLVADIPDSDQVMHAVTFSLVNQKGEVVKTYNGMTDVPFDQIVKDMKALSKGVRNLTKAILDLTGWKDEKTKNVKDYL